MRKMLFTIALLTLPTLARAATIEVTPTGSFTDYWSIQSAIDQAQSGDTVLLHAGVFNVEPSMGSELQRCTESLYYGECATECDLGFHDYMCDVYGCDMDPQGFPEICEACPSQEHCDACIGSDPRLVFTCPYGFDMLSCVDPDPYYSECPYPDGVYGSLVPLHQIMLYKDMILEGTADSSGKPITVLDNGIDPVVIAGPHHVELSTLRFHYPQGTSISAINCGSVDIHDVRLDVKRAYGSYGVPRTGIGINECSAVDIHDNLINFFETGSPVPPPQPVHGILLSALAVPGGSLIQIHDNEVNMQGNTQGKAVRINTYGTPVAVERNHFRMGGLELSSFGDIAVRDNYIENAGTGLGLSVYDFQSAWLSNMLEVEGNTMQSCAIGIDLLQGTWYGQNVHVANNTIVSTPALHLGIQVSGTDYAVFECNDLSRNANLVDLRFMTCGTTYNALRTDEPVMLGPPWYASAVGVAQPSSEACNGKNLHNEVMSGYDCGADADGDGANHGVDCDDDDPAVYPGAPELVDSLDNDCDGRVDEDIDGDGDGHPAWRDCDDYDAAIHPGALEICGNQVDENCDGLVAVEVDPYHAGCEMLVAPSDPDLVRCLCEDGTMLEVCADIDCTQGPPQDQVCTPLCSDKGGLFATGCFDHHQSCAQ